MSSSTSSGASTPTTKREAGTIQKVIRLGFCGDGTVGKTTILITYTCQAFVQDYVPTVFDNFSVIEDVEGVRVNAILWDTAGQEDFVNVRKLTYDQTDIFLVVYSVVSQNSFANLKSKWLPELRQQVGQRLRWVLVGNKCDMLTDEKTMADMKAAGETPVSEKDAKKFGKENGAELFLTCTGRDVDSVNGVFHEVLKLVVQRDLKQLKKDKKQWEKEIKEEKKLEEKMAKLALKEEKRSSKRTSNTTA